MSYFYLKPAEGHVQLHVIEECVYKRFNYFKRLHDKKEVDFCEYLLEGGVYDNIGHFLLGMLVRVSDSQPLLDFVNRSEEILFFNRIDSAAPNDMRLLCKTILKTSKDSESHMHALKILCRRLIIKQIAEHVCQKGHRSDCEFFKIHVNFEHCLPFVARRKVEITKGLACIPCGMWKYFFKILFGLNLNAKFLNLDRKSLRIDPRWREMISKLISSNSHHGISNDSIKSIRHNDIDKESLYFPLCMKNLLNILRHKHRLSHNERFRFSLFLKDIGLPIQEAIYFWQKEYSKASDPRASCSHTWSKDKSRFVYGLRHSYGLEGGRKNYCSSACNGIQNRSSAEVGCAFKHFDNEYLEKTIDPNVLDEKTWNMILEKKKSGLYNAACLLYKQAIFSHSRKSVREHVNVVFSPKDYYLDLKKNIDNDLY